MSLSFCRNRILVGSWLVITHLVTIQTCNSIEQGGLICPQSFSCLQHPHSTWSRYGYSVPRSWFQYCTELQSHDHTFQCSLLVFHKQNQWRNWQEIGNCGHMRSLLNFLHGPRLSTTIWTARALIDKQCYPMMSHFITMSLSSSSSGPIAVVTQGLLVDFFLHINNMNMC